MKVLIIISIPVYLFVGLIVDSAIKEPHEPPSMLVVVFFPILLILACVFGLMAIAIKIGEKNPQGDRKEIKRKGLKNGRKRIV